MPSGIGSYFEVSSGSSAYAFFFFFFFFVGSNFGGSGILIFNLPSTINSLAIIMVNPVKQLLLYDEFL